MKTKNFIVPHDFTDVATTALHHAIATAKLVNAEVHVMHVIAKDKDIASAEAKLDGIISAIKTDVKLTPSVRLGNIFEDIGDFAAEKHAELIFMGTHGTHGWQHVTGSNALKVVTSSKVPFVIVQDTEPNESGYDDIVVPMDLNKETKQKLVIVGEIASYFKSRVHVITPKETDEFLKNQVMANIQFAKKFFSERNIEVTATIAEGGNFDKEVLKHAKKVNGDLIAFMNLNKNSLFGALGGNHETQLINNEEKIPVLVMNPMEGIISFAGDFNG